MHALDDLHGLAAHGDLGVVVHVVQHQHHAAGREPAEIGVALHQGYRGAVARGGDRRRDARRAAAHDDHVGVGDDGYRGLRPPDDFGNAHAVASFVAVR